jgi:hypothetical protein
MAIDPSNDYFVILKRELRGGVTLWSYEISRRSRPLGVKINEGEFSTPQAAKLAGDERRCATFFASWHKATATISFPLRQPPTRSAVAARWTKQGCLSITFPCGMRFGCRPTIRLIHVISPFRSRLNKPGRDLFSSECRNRRPRLLLRQFQRRNWSPCQCTWASQALASPSYIIVRSFDRTRTERDT